MSILRVTGNQIVNRIYKENNMSGSTMFYNPHTDKAENIPRGIVEAGEQEMWSWVQGARFLTGNYDLIETVEELEKYIKKLEGL